MSLLNKKAPGFQPKQRKPISPSPGTESAFYTFAVIYYLPSLFLAGYAARFAYACAYSLARWKY